MDLQYAKQQFERYLDNYDRKDDKVRLKIAHTYGVVECSRQLAERMGLSKEDKELAQLIGLLHDIGRFEQVKRFDSFEPTVMDHAAFGVQILFEEDVPNGHTVTHAHSGRQTYVRQGMIQQFVKEDRWDGIIRTAIAKHSDFKLEGIANERELLHAKIIRDADKLDNCRVKIADAVETILEVPAQEVGKEEISAEVMEQFLRGESILSPARKTKMDYWLSYLAYFFDINFNETMDIIREKKYAERIIDRIPYSNPKTAKQMEKVREILVSYIKRGI